LKKTQTLLVLEKNPNTLGSLILLDFFSLCTKIKDSRGKRTRPQRPAPPSQFSSLVPRLLVLITLGLGKKREQGLFLNT